jgi:hypothetical protein
MKDGKDPNIRCMGGGPKCLVNPKYKDFKNSVSKTSAECYSGFMHGAGKTDPICRRLPKPTKYSNTQCFGPKGKDGKRPTSCDLTNTLTDEQIDLTNNLVEEQIKLIRSDEELDKLERKICKKINRMKPTIDNANSIYQKILNEYVQKLQLTNEDQYKIFLKVGKTCLKPFQLSSTQEDQLEYVAELPQEKQAEALKQVLENDPNIAKKIVATSSMTGNMVNTLVNNPGKAVAGLSALAGVVGAGLLMAKSDNPKEDVQKLLTNVVSGFNTLKDFVTEKAVLAKEGIQKLTGGVKEITNDLQQARNLATGEFFAPLAEQASILGSQAGDLAEVVMDNVGMGNLKAAGAAGEPVVAADKLTTG